ncbi:N-acetyltransferase, partial [Vagococcus sp.]|uniref:N-acetyltransferase n=1 Tax=Vagococcus sp. TaxID=1933889 RepID=UPI002FCBBCEE
MKLIEYSDSYKTNINNYFLTEEMTYYTGIPKDCIAISEEMPSFHSILAFSDNNELVTFFVLDEGEDKTLYTDNLNSMLLRSFSTDSHHIKKGYAKEALGLLADFVRVNFPHINEIVLAVNEKN